MNELYFSGYGYFKVDTDNKDVANEKLWKALNSVGIEFTADVNDIELRDEDGNEIE